MAEAYSMKVRDDGIVVFRLPKQSRDVIDCWMEDLSRLGTAWIEGELVLLLIDMRGVGVATPYGADSLQKVSRFTSATQNIHTAFVLDGGAAIALSNRLLDSLGPLLGEKRAFTAEDEAIRWLSRQLS
jgi:hypothetical protein